MTDETGHPALGDVIGVRVKQLRRRRGFTQRELSERMTALGEPVSPGVIAKLEVNEAGRAESMTVRRLLVLSLALNAAPVELLCPEEDGDAVEIAPGIVRPGGSVRGWVRGTWPIAEDADPGLALVTEFLATAPPGEIAERMRLRDEYAARHGLTPEEDE